MTAPAVLGAHRTSTPSYALLRPAILPLLIVSGALGQALQPQSEEDRAAEMKKRVIETLNLRPGDTAADVGCGDGFYTIPMPRFLGPSGKVFAEDISDAELFKLFNTGSFAKTPPLIGLLSTSSRNSAASLSRKPNEPNRSEQAAARVK
jgi:predicted methyltransferase